MRGFSVIGIGEAANLLESSTTVAVFMVGGMRATELISNGKNMVLVQGTGENFLLFK